MTAAKFSEGLLDEDKILEALQIRPGMTVLDAGCGSGYMSLKFSRLVGDSGRVWALDVDKAFITRLGREIGQQSNITPLQADITVQTVLDRASVDLIYLSTVFHVFSAAQVSGFDSEVNRLLKPKGRLAVVNIHKKEMRFGPPLTSRSSPRELKQKLSLRPGELVEVNEFFYLQLFEKA